MSFLMLLFTSQTTVEIRTTQEFIDLSYKSQDNVTIKLLTDLDFSASQPLYPIQFTGTFDGGNFKLKNAKLNIKQINSINYGSLFYSLGSITIQNLNLENIQFIQALSTQFYVAPLVSYAQSTQLTNITSLTFSFSSDPTSQTGTVGGLVAKTDSITATMIQTQANIQMQQKNSVTMQFLLAGFCSDCAKVNATGIITEISINIDNKFSIIGGVVGICSDLVLNGAKITFTFATTGLIRTYTGMVVGDALNLNVTVQNTLVYFKSAKQNYMGFIAGRNLQSLYTAPINFYVEGAEQLTLNPSGTQAQQLNTCDNCYSKQLTASGFQDYTASGFMTFINQFQTAIPAYRASNKLESCQNVTYAKFQLPSCSCVVTAVAQGTKCVDASFCYAGGKICGGNPSNCDLVNKVCLSTMDQLTLVLIVVGAGCGAIILALVGVCICVAKRRAKTTQAKARKLAHEGSDMFEGEEKQLKNSQMLRKSIKTNRPTTVLTENIDTNIVEFNQAQLSPVQSQFGQKANIERKPKQDFDQNLQNILIDAHAPDRPQHLKDTIQMLESQGHKVKKIIKVKKG